MGYRTSLLGRRNLTLIYDNSKKTKDDDGFQCNDFKIAVRSLMKRYHKREFSMYEGILIFQLTITMMITITMI